jgi:acyl-CoA reductase-like NAD-dependent aldehyde dehydrogenase
MDTAVQRVLDISQSEAALRAKAELILETGRWAAAEFWRYDRQRLQAIVEAVARAGHAKAGDYADWAVKETGFGVAAHKTLKNEASSLGLVEHYRDHDFVNPRLDEARKIIEIPRPAGVVFALTPSTNPIATVYFKVLTALMTRNAIVISPHPAARDCSVDAVRTLADAAEAAGAPVGAVQVIEAPTLPLIDAFMRSPTTDVILATGGNAMVRAAYSSSTPAIGVGPGNAPCFVDSSAEPRRAASLIVESKSFDNSVLCTNESVVFCLEDNRQALEAELKRAGCHICTEDETSRLRSYLFHERGFNVEALGRDAAWIAKEAGVKAPPKTKVLVTPIHLIGVDEPLSREKLCPVLGLYTARSRDQALTQARALLRQSGAGHSAAIHASNPDIIRRYAMAVEAYRVVVNAPCSQGAAGFATHLPPTYTIGTGFFGHSSIGENIGPQHLVHWTRIAWNAEDALPGDLHALMNLDHKGPLPPAPADGVPGLSARPPTNVGRPSGGDDSLRDEIRRIIAEELRDALRKGGR